MEFIKIRIDVGISVPNEKNYALLVQSGLVIYAGAQKNIGLAGATLVIIKKDLLKKCTSKSSFYAKL